MSLSIKERENKSPFSNPPSEGAGGGLLILILFLLLLASCNNPLNTPPPPVTLNSQTTNEAGAEAIWSLSEVEMRIMSCKEELFLRSEKILNSQFSID